MARSIRFSNCRGQTLAGSIHTPTGWRRGGRAAVVCHGMLSYRDSPKHVRIARELSGRGFCVLRFDFAGRGESDGTLRELTLGRQVEDLTASVQHLRGMGAGRVSLVGSSLGGATVILFSDPSSGVVALATLASVSRPGALFRQALTPEQLRIWETRGELVTEQGPLGWGFMQDARRQDVLGAAARVECPALLVHGSDDETVPPSSSRELAGAMKGRASLQIIDGADHRFSREAHLDQAVSLVTDWLDGNG